MAQAFGGNLAIMDIYNEAILNTTAVYNYQPYTFEYVTDWFKVKREGQYPVLGLEEDGVHEGQLAPVPPHPVRGLGERRPARRRVVVADQELAVHGQCAPPPLRKTRPTPKPAPSAAAMESNP